MRSSSSSSQRRHVIGRLGFDGIHTGLVAVLHLELKVLLEHTLHSLRIEVHARLRKREERHI